MDRRLIFLYFTGFEIQKLSAFGLQIRKSIGLHAFLKV